MLSSDSSPRPPSLSATSSSGPPSDFSTSPTATAAEGAAGAGPSIDITQDQKVLIIGGFQTGKTNLAKYLLYGFPRWVAWDPTYALPGGVQTLSAAKWQYEQSGMAVLQPGRGDIAPLFGEFCGWTFDLRNTMVFVDEPAMVMSSRGTIPDDFNDLYRLGHKLGNGVMLATHRYHGDLPALTRILHHLFAFQTTIDNDIEALSGHIGKEGARWLWDHPPRYQFWYHGSGYSGPAGPVPRVE